MLKKSGHTFYLCICAAVIGALAGCGTMKKEPQPAVTATDNAEVKGAAEVSTNEENAEKTAQEIGEEETKKAEEAKEKIGEEEPKDEGKLKVGF